MAPGKTPDILLPVAGRFDYTVVVSDMEEAEEMISEKRICVICKRVYIAHTDIRKTCGRKKCQRKLSAITSEEIRERYRKALLK